MENKFDLANEIINHNICGFHRYVLSDPMCVDFVSANLCEMLAISENEIVSDSEDLYAKLIHTNDKDAYSRFLHDAKTAENSISCEYRIMKKDGSYLYVNDTMSVERKDDGQICGYSVLTDISKLKSENNNLQFLNETIPCGFLKYTCEKQPRVTYINEKMMEFLRLPQPKDGELDYTEMYKENIFLMIPIEERRKFALYLNRVYSIGVPIAGEMTVLRCDGTRAHLFGWVTKCVNEQGVEEFQSVCIDITERHQAKKANEAKQYIKAIKDIYDKIFRYDLSNNTVNCLYSNDSPAFKWLENIPMQMEDATEKWIEGTVVEEDRDKIRDFFNDFRLKRLYTVDGKPPQITYKAMSSSGEIKMYSGIFLKMDDSVSLYCCRNIVDSNAQENLENAYNSLKENMHDLIMRFTDGLAAFEIKNGLVRPLYASDNVCGFFGVTKEEWMKLMKRGTPLREFVAKSNVDYETFEQMLMNGEAEFTYYDFEKEKERQIKAICSQKSNKESTPRYIMLYNVEENDDESDKQADINAVTIRTFGYFDVFVGEKPIVFRNKKAKELFALLVDRRGGYVTSQEAICFLWEDEPVNSVTLSRYRKVALRLKNTLEEYGIQDIIESVDGNRRIVMEKVQCDLYNYLSGKEEYANLFKGSYLTNYSWGENTLAELSGDIMY